jgi:hypothetical protein
MGGENVVGCLEHYSLESGPNYRLSANPLAMITFVNTKHLARSVVLDRSYNSI